MKTINFRPKYRWLLSISVGGAILLTLVLIVLIFDKPPPASDVKGWLAILGVISLTSLIPLIYLKEIEFTASRLRVKRYLWPDRVIEYNQVRQMVPYGVVVTEGRDLTWRLMTNSEELKRIFDQLADEGKITEFQKEDGLQEKRKVQAWTLAVSFVPGLIIGGVVVYLGLFTSYSSLLPVQVFRSGVWREVFITGALGGSYLLSYLFFHPLVARTLAD